MRFVSCSKCHKLIPAKHSVVVERKRVCRECLKKNKKGESHENPMA